MGSEHILFFPDLGDFPRHAGKFRQLAPLFFVHASTFLANPLLRLLQRGNSSTNGALENVLSASALLSDVFSPQLPRLVFQNETSTPMKLKASPDFACEWLMWRPRDSWHGMPDHKAAANGGQKVNSVARPFL
jgi:hypothetical protein